MPELVPLWIVKDGERYRFDVACPGWLVYENYERERVIHVGRDEATILAETDTVIVEEHDGR